MANFLNKLCGTNTGKDKTNTDANNNIVTNAAGQPLPSTTVVGTGAPAYPIYETQQQPLNAQTSSSLGWGASSLGSSASTTSNFSAGSSSSMTTSNLTSSTLSSNTSSSMSSMSSSNFNNISSSGGVQQLPTVVAPAQQLPPQVLPTVQKEEILPTEVRRVQEHQQQHVVQPMVREVVQPVETIVKKPIQTEVQPVRETIVHPKVENIVHTAPSEVVQPIHETNKLQTVEKRIDRPPVELGTKTGSVIPEPPAVVKEPLHPQLGDKTTGFSTSSQKTSETNFSASKTKVSSSGDKSLSNKAM
jgi:hypothetical protein